MSNNSYILNKLRAKRFYWFAKAKNRQKAENKIKEINKEISQITNKPEELIVSEYQEKRGRPQKIQ